MGKTPLEMFFNSIGYDSIIGEGVLKNTVIIERKIKMSQIKDEIEERLTDIEELEFNLSTLSDYKKYNKEGNVALSLNKSSDTYRGYCLTVSSGFIESQINEEIHLIRKEIVGKTEELTHLFELLKNELFRKED